MTKPADSDSKQAIPSPEDRVRAEMVEKARKVCIERLTKVYARAKHVSSLEVARKLAEEWTQENEEEEWVNDIAEFALSLVEELIPFCDSPCGHTSQYAYSEDGGKNIVCLICEREEPKGQAAEIERERSEIEHTSP